MLLAMIANTHPRPTRTAQDTATRHAANMTEPQSLDLRLKEARLPARTPKTPWNDEQLQSKLPDSRPRNNPSSGTDLEIRRSSRHAQLSSAMQEDAIDSFGNFFQVTEDQLPGCVDPHFLEQRIDIAHSSLRRLGFTSAWDMALAIGDGKSSEYVKACSDQIFSQDCAENIIERATSQLTPEIICNVSKSTYTTEWEKVRCLDILRQDFNNATLATFDFGTIYQKMRQTAPNLLSLFELLSNVAGSTNTAPESSRQRYVVMTLAQLAHFNNSQTNFVQ